MKISFALLLMLFICTNSLANEKKPLKESTVFNKTFSWQAQAGVSLQYTTSIIKGVNQDNLGNYLNISILFDFYYKGFFIQSDHRRADTHNLGAEIGYQLIVEDDWELDVISKSYIGGFNPEEVIDIADKDIPILMGLKSRGTADGIGIRYTRFHDDSIFSFDIAALAPLSAADGWVMDAFYSHIVPYRNWDIYLNAGMTYYSDKVMNYYVGIDSEEVSPLREEFTAHHALRTQVEVFAQYPLSKSWTFNIGLSQNYYFGDLSESPIVETENASQIMAGVLYVF
ncbi:MULTISPECIES: MipA/OmpV family protein [Thalassotalea]|uniref:MipA/OmpV family protein n=1 Tax=Thalassotalea castellviae TaxID=3075612 RepID=A0ABU2ZZ75_9GAMM|nr:MipA/OmpV family protein [Thalassotalea sp. W431]MDT0602928.1 MipA/OmpV family protein [Thalassotalea sp. W431]